MVTKTFGKLHFEDLKPIRFESLILAMIFNTRRWIKLDHLGAQGSDDGIDIRAEELLENGKHETYYFQCKCYQKIHFGALKKIVDDFLSVNTMIPDFYIIVLGCNVSKAVMDKFDDYCKKAGFRSVAIWTASFLEAKLYAQHHDLLFAYFGVNLTEQRTNRIGAIRRNVAMKKRMHQDFIKPYSPKDRISHIERIDKPWIKFRHSEVLIRSIHDKSYPDNTLMNQDYSGYFKAEVYDFYHNGLMVRAHPYVATATVRFEDYHKPGTYTTSDVKVELLGCIPFDSIIEYDIDGDEYYPYPHLYCDFIHTTDPYEKIVYMDSDTNYKYRDDEIVKIQ